MPIRTLRDTCKRSPVLKSSSALLLFCLSLCFALILPVSPITVQPAHSADMPLQRVAPAGNLVGFDQQLWGRGNDRQALLTSIDYSLKYLRSPAADTAYGRYPVPGFSVDRVYRSLSRFRQLLTTARSPEELQAAVRQEFDLYQSVGNDGKGTVGFTGYFQPTYAASRVQTAEFRYPLYRMPNLSGLGNPTRLDLEGRDGLGGKGLLRGLELVWLRDRLEAYLVQVQGSAQLQMTDGSTLSVGYSGHTDYPYVSMGRELVNAGKFRLEELSLPVLIQYFRQNPAEMDVYIPRNNRFVFFNETTGTPATGSLGVPVTAERSIATDKSLMPPGALALIQTQIPQVNGSDSIISEPVGRYVLDQDTGGAIRGAGRVDIFMGTGTQAGDRAGMINGPGQLYYLLIKE
jgi:membrane-bound lytic murein transglycosylase A